VLTSNIGDTLSEAGTESGGSFALSSYVFVQDQSSTSSDSSTGSAVENDTGADTASGTDSYTGIQTSSYSNQDASTSEGTLTEDGNWSGGSFALSTVGYTGDGTDSFSSSDSTTKSWSGSYTGLETASDSSSSADCYTDTAVGSFSSGSYSLSSFVLQGASSGSASDSDSQSQDDNGSSSSYSNTQASQDSVSVYQSEQDTMLGAMKSYNFQETGSQTMTDGENGPGYSSSDTLVVQNSASQSEYGGTASSAGTYTYTTSSGGGTYTNSGSGAPTAPVPDSAVQFAAPDGNLVPTVGAGQSTGGGSSGGDASSGSGGGGATVLAPGGSSVSLTSLTSPSSSDAPVPANISYTQTSSTSSWLKGTSQTSQSMVNVASNATQIQQSKTKTGTSGGITAAGVDMLTNPLTAMATAHALSFMPSAAAITIAPFNGQVWTAVQPLSDSMMWLNDICPMNAAFIQVPTLQSILGIGGNSPDPSKTGDPLVDWVDSVLNSGSLAVGSLPIYGGGNSTAFAALDQGIGAAITLICSSMPLFGAGFSMGMAAMQGDWGGVAMGALGLVAMLKPCSMLAKGMFAYGAITSAAAIIENPNDPMVGFHAIGLVGSVAGLMGVFGSCFTGDMLIDVECGKKRSDEIRVGDKVWSRHEREPEGPLVLKAVEKRFVRQAGIWNVRVADQLLRTTGEHPFWVESREGGRWLMAKELKEGDWLRTREGSLVSVESVEDAGIFETVYNWQVADYHTYFVSGDLDRVGIWAHNNGEGCGAASKAEQGGAAAEGGGLAASEGSVTPSRNAPITPARRTHILDSDATGGGHGAGRGTPNKSEFPAGVSDDQAIGMIKDVAESASSTEVPGRNGKTIVRGSRNGLDIEVILYPNGSVCSGYPTNVPRNPRR
jgi:hypothetical protein